jgi:hypothetical protein
MRMPSIIIWINLVTNKHYIARVSRLNGVRINETDPAHPWLEGELFVLEYNVFFSVSLGNYYFSIPYIKIIWSNRCNHYSIWQHQLTIDIFIASPCVFTIATCKNGQTPHEERENACCNYSLTYPIKHLVWNVTCNRIEGVVNTARPRP